MRSGGGRGQNLTARQLIDQLRSRGAARALGGVTGFGAVSEEGPAGWAGSGVSGVSPVKVGEIEVAVARDATDTTMRRTWRERVGTSSVDYLLLADDPKRAGCVRVLGPKTPKESIRSVVAESLAATLVETAKLRPLEAIRRLTGELVRLAGDGLAVNGLLTRHTLEHRFQEDAARWSDAQTIVAEVPDSADWRRTLGSLGYRLDRLKRGYLAVYDAKPVAVVHPKGQATGLTRLDTQGRPPEGLLAADCRAKGARYGILAQGKRLRLFDMGASAVVADGTSVSTPPPNSERTASATADWLELDTELLGADRRPFLALLAPAYLAESGFAQLLEEAKNFGLALRDRLDETIRQEALPALAVAMERWAKKRGIALDDDGQRKQLEQAALTLVFRVIFILFGESAKHLPMHNDAYRKSSLTALVREARDTKHKMSSASSVLWHGFVRLVKAMRQGNPAWDVPAYNGELFAADDFEGAKLLEEMELSDPEFATVLTAIGYEAAKSGGGQRANRTLTSLPLTLRTLATLTSLS